MSTPPPKRAVLAFAGTRRGRWLALAVWALLAAVGFSLAPQLADIQDDAQINWLPADAESTEAKRVAEAEFNQNGLTTLLVVYTADTPLTPSDHAAVEADRTALDALAAPGENTAGPIPSDDGEALMLVVPIAETAIDDDGEALFAEADSIIQAGLPDGLEAGFTGGAAASLDMESAFEQLDGPLTYMTVAVVALVLILTYRSPLLLLLPLVCIALSEQLATGLAYLLGTYANVTINGQNTGILTVLVFGVSTDYTLLLVSRYREELLRDDDRFAAMRKALTRSMPAIVASAGTVILALAVMPLASVSSTAALGPVLIAGVVSAVLASLTLLPAVLSLFGRAVFWPVVPRYDPAEAHAPAQHRHRFWGRIAAAVGVRPRLIALATTTGLILLTLGWTSLSVGLERSELLTTETASQRVSARMAEHYPAGSSEPVEIYLHEEDTAAALAVLEAEAGIAQINEPVQAAASDWVRIDAVLADEASSDAAEHTVLDVREAFADNGTDTLVSGPTATQIDLADGNDRDLRLLIPLILAVVFLVIVLLLRAITAALVLMACTVLSYAAAVGAANLIFQATGHGNVDTSFLLMGFLFLVAMGIDYTIFLMTRVREEVPRWGHRVGTLRALTLTGGVITSAGIVLAATFTVLALMPLTMLMQLGIVVCVGVLLDAIIVRTLLVPALALWIGDKLWWPGRIAEQHAETREPEPQEASV
ncbi:MMPL family transporter [Glycomyces rhizosphaerae]|uniref:MMPL family transporter n=1 Tax=Glycomyces rhizosphaerae TaxID=2054422 RepID=A0ABV7Q6K1_9ACTN